MADTDDLVRLVDDPATPAELRSLLTAARAEGIDAAAVARVHTRVHQRLVHPGVRWRRWWGVAGGVAVLVGWLAVRPAPHEEISARAHESDAPIQAAEQTSSPTRAEGLPSTPALDLTARSPAPASARTRASAVARVEPRRASKSVALDPTPVVPASSASSEEAQLLLAARRKLARDPAGALARADEHARRFADGELAQERELVAVRALLALGRRAEAEARAERFAVRFPSSVHIQAIARALDPE